MRYSITLFLIFCFQFPASERHREQYGFFAFQIRCSDTEACFACGSTSRQVFICPFYCLRVASTEKEIQTIQHIFPPQETTAIRCEAKSGIYTLVNMDVSSG